MSLNDYQRLTVKIQREDLPLILFGIAHAIREYCNQPLPEQNPTLDDFFRTFPEGSRELDLLTFFVQNRIKQGGRLAVGYFFGSDTHPDGELRTTIFDNGENIPFELRNQVYQALKHYFLKTEIQVLEEATGKEY